LAVARAARLLEPKAVVVENVQGVGSDRRLTMHRCTAALEELGYSVTGARLDLGSLGVPQRRIRHVLIATDGTEFDWKALPQTPPRALKWAVGDLLDAAPTAMIDTPSRVSARNRERIDWLFENDRYDLPNDRRPVCHQSDHSYRSMYGRL